MRKKYIKIKNVKIEIAFFYNEEERCKKISGFQEIDKKEEEKLDKKQKTSRGNINVPEPNDEKVRGTIEKINVYLSFFVYLLTLITTGGMIFYFFANNEYQIRMAQLFSLPKNFFSIDIYEGILIWILLVPLFLYIFNIKVKKLKVPFYLYFLTVEILFLIFNMLFWSDKLDIFFKKCPFYSSHPETFVYTFLLALIVVLFVINSLVFITSKKINSIILITLYIIMFGLACWGKGKGYQVVTENKNIEVVIGYCDGRYAIVPASISEDGKTIILEKDSVELKKIEDIKKVKKMYFREEKFGVKNVLSYSEKRWFKIQRFRYKRS